MPSYAFYTAHEAATHVQEGNREYANKPWLAAVMHFINLEVGAGTPAKVHTMTFDDEGRPLSFLIEYDN